MDKFVIRTKRSPRPERKITETANRKKQSTIESLAVNNLIICFVTKLRYPYASLTIFLMPFVKVNW